MYQQVRILLSKLPVGQAVTVVTRYWSQILVFVVTATGCWYLWSPEPSKPETYKPEVKQADGSIVVERKPDPEAHAAMLLPSGSKLQRKITVTVQAKNPIQTISDTVTVEEIKTAQLANVENKHIEPETTIECPPVTLDLALVRMPDDSQRVVASSEDGNILGAVDIPVENAAPFVPKIWAAGLVADPFKQTLGAFVDRDLGWMRLGAQINQRETGDIPNQIWLKAGVRW